MFTVGMIMKALIVDNYGPPQAAHIGEIDKPPLKDGSLLVKIHAAGINPFDYKIITGMVKDMMRISFPYVPGMGGAGVVDEIGQGVRDWRKGDAVLGMFETGTLAEYALISANSKRLARKPDALDFDRAAAIPEAGLTATTIMRAGDVRQGQTVFVIGATGGLDCSRCSSPNYAEPGSLQQERRAMSSTCGGWGPTMSSTMELVTRWSRSINDIEGELMSSSMS